MDVFRHVNNTVYFRYFEIARIAFLERIGLDSDDRQDGIGPILHSTGARFRRPLRHPDTAWTATRATQVERDRFEMEYRVASERLGEIVAEGTAIVVAFDYRLGSKAPLPEEVRAAMERVGRA
jgi:acyl-CoA thioester hydrolase